MCALDKNAIGAGDLQLAKGDKGRRKHAHVPLHPQQTHDGAACRARVDRHESLGIGKIGWEAFRYIMNDPRFDEIPMVLETIDSSIWDVEIQQLYALIEE